MKNLLKLLLALLLLPTLFFLGVETLRGLFEALGDVKTALVFGAGAAVYGVIHFSLYQFQRMYVFGHELTHAVTAVLFGYRIKDIRIHKNSGFVKMDDCNAAVALSPYFIPAYVVGVGLVYMALSLFTEVSLYRLVFVFLTGFFMAFHFIQTFRTLFETNQPDLKLAGGAVFSTVTIIFINLMILLLVLKALFPERIALLELLQNTAVSSFNAWKIVINYTIEGIINSSSR